MLGLNYSVEEIVGAGAVAFKTGLFSFAGQYVCDGIFQTPILLGPGCKRQFSASLADIRRCGRFHSKPEPAKIPRQELKRLV